MSSLGSPTRCPNLRPRQAALPTPLGPFGSRTKRRFEPSCEPRPAANEVHPLQSLQCGPMKACSFSTDSVQVLDSMMQADNGAAIPFLTRGFYNDGFKKARLTWGCDGCVSLKKQSHPSGRSIPETTFGNRSQHVNTKHTGSEPGTLPYRRHTCAWTCYMYVEAIFVLCISTEENRNCSVEDTLAPRIEQAVPAETYYEPFMLSTGKLSQACSWSTCPP